MSKTTKFVISILLVAVIALTFGIGYQMGNRNLPSQGGELDTVAENSPACSSVFAWGIGPSFDWTLIRQTLGSFKKKLHPLDTTKTAH